MTIEFNGRKFTGFFAFGSGAINRRQQAIARASQFEALEDRTLLSATSGFDVDTGTLTITAKGGNDVNLSTDLSGDVTLNGSSLGVSATLVIHLRVVGGNGGNTI
ncbi:MAG: hypothetical protein KDA36_13155, partial [Planctomycetaceae bacterium]|nr:hypothetical protein [Planctomycetaceae bacterium]